MEKDFLLTDGEDGKGQPLVAWDQVCAPKSKGGADLWSIQVVNAALICKWLWRFREEVNSLWCQVVAAKYGVMVEGDPSATRKTTGRSPWKGIMKNFQDFKGGLQHNVRNGRSTFFERTCGVGKRLLSSSSWRRIGLRRIPLQGWWIMHLVKGTTYFWCLPSESLV